MVIKRYLLLSLVLIFLSCSNIKLSNEKTIGKWKAKNGASIKLKQDNSARVVVYPCDFSNGKYKETINGVGTWKMYKNDNSGWKVVEITLTTDKFISDVQSNGIVIELLNAQNGFFGSGKDIKS